VAFQHGVIDARSALFAVNTYTWSPRTVRVGQQFTVRVVVCGPEAQCGTAGVPAPAVSQVTAGHLKGGARIDARVNADPPGQVIDSAAGSPQPVIEVTDSTQWQWRLRADKTGSFEVRVALTPLVADTSTPLVPSTTIAQTITVTDTAADRMSSAWRWLTGPVATGIAALAGSIGAIIAVITAVRALRPSGPQASSKEPTTSGSPESGLQPTAPANEDSTAERPGPTSPRSDSGTP
jgi:hypothetical protein